MPLTSGQYSNVESEAYSYLTANGFNDAVATGILANIETESGFNTKAYNAGEGAYGLCQWRSGRKSGLISSYGTNPNAKSQIAYILDELASTESRAASYLKNIPNTAEGARLAALNFAKYYERCDSASFALRQDRALAYWNYYTSGSAVILPASGDLTLPRGISELDTDPVAMLSLMTPEQLYLLENLESLVPAGYASGILRGLTYGGAFSFYVPEFSESAGVNYETIHIPGRSSDILSYDSTSSRQVTLNLDLYAGVGMYSPISDADDVVGRMHADLNFVKSLEYPDYSGDFVDPPNTVSLMLGSAFSMIGVVTDVKVEHLKPLDTQNRCMYAKLSFTVKQHVTDPPGQADIRRGATGSLTGTGRGGIVETGTSRPAIDYANDPRYSASEKPAIDYANDPRYSNSSKSQGTTLNSNPVDDRGFPSSH